MKITKSYLRKVIMEELERQNESENAVSFPLGTHKFVDDDKKKYLLKLDKKDGAKETNQFVGNLIENPPFGVAIYIEVTKISRPDGTATYEISKLNPKYQKYAHIIQNFLNNPSSKENQ